MSKLPPPLVIHERKVSGDVASFKLDKAFVQGYKFKPLPFGFNGFGELVYRRTYSRPKDEEDEKSPNAGNEEWFETVERVVNGTYSLQKEWVQGSDLGWEDVKAQESAQEMYDLIFNMKFLPPGRGLWAMGSELTTKPFVSTKNLLHDKYRPFTFLMDASMLGVGVGFDIRGADILLIRGIDYHAPAQNYVIPDSREGWVEALKLTLQSHFEHLPRVEFDFTQIRPKNVPIKGFGGKASGYECLEQLLKQVNNILSHRQGAHMTGRDIVDIMNLIGCCVVAGNVRRTAEIAFGDPYDEEYLNLKNYQLNPERGEFGWTSNNSIFCNLGMDYSKVADITSKNGEPGYCWLKNMQDYGLMNGIPDGIEGKGKDFRAEGGNPCLEQTLESYELCCLVEVFPNRHETKAEFLRTLKFAYLYAKTVTLGKTHWPETNRVLLRNRRIGCSLSGIQQFITDKKEVKRSGIDILKEWCVDGKKEIEKYDSIYSNWLAIPRSIKTTSIKPSGTVSLLAGATPGMHWAEARFYIRRMRLAMSSELVAPLRAANYHIEPAKQQVGSEVVESKDTCVVSFPIDAGVNIRPLNEVSMWEQLNMAAFLQEYWADNQVSCTVTFDPKTEAGQIKHALDYFQYKLKGVSFLPRLEYGAYLQMPYEKITEKEYNQMMKQIRPVSLRNTHTSMDDSIQDRFCDGDTCLAPSKVARLTTGDLNGSPEVLAAAN